MYLGPEFLNIVYDFIGDNVNENSFNCLGKQEAIDSMLTMDLYLPRQCGKTKILKRIYNEFPFNSKKVIYFTLNSALKKYAKEFVIQKPTQYGIYSISERFNDILDKDTVILLDEVPYHTAEPKIMSMIPEDFRGRIISLHT